MAEETVRTAADFLALIDKERAKTERLRDPTYGSRVMPVLELYKSLKSFEERKAFQAALEKLLSDEDKSKRSFAVDVCLGFFVFRDVF